MAFGYINIAAFAKLRRHTRTKIHMIKAHVGAFCIIAVRCALFAGKTNRRRFCRFKTAQGIHSAIVKINFFGNGRCINIFRKIPAGHKSKSSVGRLRQYQLGIAGKISRIDGTVIQMQNHSALKMGLQSLLPVSCWYQHRFRGNRIGISAALCQLPYPFNHIVRLFPAGHNRDQYLLKFLAGQNLIRKFCHTI